MARLFRRLGYRVEHTQASNDHGADLLLKKGRKTIAVQAKDYAKPAGNKAVQEVFAAKAYYGCSEAWVVASSGFTAGAMEQAQPCEVRLLGEHELALLKRSAKARSILPAFIVVVTIVTFFSVLMFTKMGD